MTMERLLKFTAIADRHAGDVFRCRVMALSAFFPSDKYRLECTQMGWFPTSCQNATRPLKFPCNCEQARWRRFWVPRNGTISFFPSDIYHLQCTQVGCIHFACHDAKTTPKVHPDCGQASWRRYQDSSFERSLYRPMCPV